MTKTKNYGTFTTRYPLIRSVEFNIGYYEANCNMAEYFRCE